MSGGIESMHEDEPRDHARYHLDAAQRYYDWACTLPADKQARAALELAHQLIIAMANYASRK